MQKSDAVFTGDVRIKSYSATVSMIDGTKTPITVPGSWFPALVGRIMEFVRWYRRH